MSETNIQSSPAILTGAATRISAAEKAAINAKALPAVLRATIHVTRASTGKVETYEIVGTPADDTPTTANQE